ncbi:MAG: AbrB/MazE/SpoVT family DNA-binding domain-containing protein [Candidatus Limnocylindrales bacterium]
MNRVATISRGGQVSIPAEVRRRWSTQRVTVEDLGDRIILRPVPADPIGAAAGSLRRAGPGDVELRAQLREEEAEADEAKAARSRIPQR